MVYQIKEEAMKRSRKAYVLADKSKFNKISCITFGEIDEATIITTRLQDTRYYNKTEIMEALL